MKQHTHACACTTDRYPSVLACDRSSAGCNNDAACWPNAPSRTYCCCCCARPSARGHAWWGCLPSWSRRRALQSRTACRSCTSDGTHARQPRRARTCACVYTRAHSNSSMDGAAAAAAAVCASSCSSRPAAAARPPRPRAPPTACRSPAWRHLVRLDARKAPLLVELDGAAACAAIWRGASVHHVSA